MKDILLILTIILISNTSNSAEKYGDVIEKYNIDNKEYVVTQEITYQELWKVNPDTKNKTS